MHEQDIGELIFIASWCNGSTKDFGSFRHGSSPCEATKNFQTHKLVVTLLYSGLSVISRVFYLGKIV